MAQIGTTRRKKHIEIPSPSVVPIVKAEFLPPEKTIRCYALERKSPYLWNILEVTINNNRVIHVNRDVQSLKQIKIEKILDLLDSGGLLNEPS